MVMLFVFRGVNERDSVVSSALSKVGDHVGSLVELPKIACPKRSPFRRGMAEPLPKGSRRRNLFHPQVNRGGVL